MSAAVVVAVVVIAVFLVGVTASLCWRRYKKSRERAELEEWAESQLGTGSLINHDSLAAVTPTDPSRIRFTMYRNPHHGFALEYPANWRCSQSPSPSESLVAHFSCPDSEPSFKRLSVVRLQSAAILSPRESPPSRSGVGRPVLDLDLGARLCGSCAMRRAAAPLGPLLTP